MREIEIGKCECCGAENVELERTYFRYPFSCECHAPSHFVMVRHCKDCKPKEPEETKVVLKTADLKNPFAFAFQIIKKRMREERDIEGGIYFTWQSGLAMMIHDETGISYEKSNEIARKYLDLLFM